MHPTSVIYGYGQSHIWGGATGSHVTGSDVSHVTGSDVRHMTRSYSVRKYVLRMCNWKLRNIRPSRTFWPKVTKSRDRKRPCPEVGPLGVRNRKLRNIHSNWRSRDPFGSVHGVFSTTSASYYPRKPCILYLVTGTSLGYLTFYFHIVSRLCSTSTKSTFDHPIEGHSAFIQACDWFCI